MASLTTLQQKEVAEILDQLGFHKKDQIIYLALLASRPITLTPLARAVRMPVTTVQAIVGRLEKRGVVYVTKRKSRHVYEAYEVNVLKTILEEQVKSVVGIIPLLKKLQGSAEYNAKIRIYYRERMTDIFHEALDCKGKIIYEIVAAKDLQGVLGERFHFSKRRLERGIKLKSLRVESREIKRYSRQTHIRELREAKFLPREMIFRSSILFWDNSVAFFSTTEEGLAWVVESPVLHEMIEQFFAMLWSISRTMETVKE